MVSLFDLPCRETIIILLATATFSTPFSCNSVHQRSHRNSLDRLENDYCMSLFGVKAPYLLPDPPDNSLGNFFDDKMEDMSFIQCNMLAVGEIAGTQYGVGFPLDMPVMLTYFEGSELKPVMPDYPDYDHLLNHVAVQMDGNDFQLYRTPIVLTLQGEFEDEDLNQNNPFDDYEDEEDQDEEEYDEVEEEEEEEEVTLEQLLAEDFGDDEDYDDEEWDDDDDDDDDDDNEKSNSENDDNSNMSSFWTSSPVGKIDPKYQAQPDVTVMRPEKVDVSDIPKEAFVTAEDTKALRRAHRKADRIMDYAADIKLIASFHYKKKNYHLVRLLEPLFIIGQRMDDIKGYYFTLLDEQKSDEIRPVLENLLLEARNRKRQERNEIAKGSMTVATTAAESGTGDGDRPINSGDSSISTPTGGRRSRRRWTNRKRKEE